MLGKKGFREHLEVLRSVLNTIPHLVSYVDRDLVYQFANPAHAKWFQKTPEEVIGKPMREILGEELFKLAHPEILKVLSGVQVEFETEIVRVECGKKIVHVNYIPDLGADGEAVGFMTFTQDITQLRTQHTRLQESERRLRYALEATGEGVWDWSVPHGTVKHNAQWCNLLGLDDGFLVHPLEQFAERIHPTDKPEVMVRLQACLEGKGTYLSEHRMQRSDGTYIWVMDRGNVVERDSNGAPLRMVGSFKDISDIREAQVRLFQSSKMASLGEMAGGIAHEINNPLAIIHGKAGQLRSLVEEGSEHIDLAKFKKDLTRIEETAQRIAKIVKGLRLFSRNSDEDSMEKVALLMIIEDTLELCKERFKQASIELKVQSSVDVNIECRPAQVSQVVMNLLSNAHDAVERLAEKWVSLEVRQFGDKVQVAVTDSGPGIPPEIAENIMLPFFTTKEVGKGTGLGLSISKGISEDHQGKLFYDPQFKNTRFVLELPIKQMNTELVRKKTS